VTDDVLLDALDRLRGTGSEFGGFLANHGPMAAEALVQIGAAEAVPRWVDAYRTRLDTAPEVVRGIGDDDWRAHLGDPRSPATGRPTCAARPTTTTGARCSCAGGRGCSRGSRRARRTV
jgi:hypothetical protein